MIRIDHAICKFLIAIVVGLLLAAVLMSVIK